MYSKISNSDTHNAGFACLKCINHNLVLLGEVFFKSVPTWQLSLQCSLTLHVFLLSMDTGAMQWNYFQHSEITENEWHEVATFLKNLGQKPHHHINLKKSPHHRMPYLQHVVHNACSEQAFTFYQPRMSILQCQRMFWKLTRSAAMNLAMATSEYHLHLWAPSWVHKPSSMGSIGLCGPVHLGNPIPLSTNKVLLLLQV